jgi:Arm DNA-binding domain
MDSPKSRKTLSDRAIPSLPTGMYRDKEHFYLKVRKDGYRQWIFKYTSKVDGRPVDILLGSYPKIGLKDARLLAAVEERNLSIGQDPKTIRQEKKKKQPGVPTFEEISKIVIAEAKTETNVKKNHYQWELYLGPKYCGSILKNL